MNATAKRVLVTGAAGFVGQHLCRQLRAAGYQVRTYTKGSKASADANAQFVIPSAADIPTAATDFVATVERSPKSDHITADICDADELKLACSNVDTVFHLAGIAHVSGVDAASLQRVNVEGTRNVLDAAISCAVRRIVFFSSSVAEVTVTDPAHSAGLSSQTNFSSYAQSKRQAEALLLAAGERGDIEVVILRPVNVYGPGMKGNIRSMIRLIAKGVLPPLPKLSNQISLVGVVDLCRAAILAAESLQANGRIYCVTDGEPYRINAIEEAIYNVLGRKKPRWHSPRMLIFAAALLGEIAGRLRPGKLHIGLQTYRNLVNENLCSNVALCSELGFHPTTTLYQELPAIVTGMAL